jgi:hypothetical protein
MPKLAQGLPLKVPREYDPNPIRDIILALCSQLDNLSEGRGAAVYNASSVTPSGSVAAYATGDEVAEPNPTVQASLAPGLPIQYVRYGRVWTTSGSPGTFQELRVPIGTMSSVPSGTVWAAAVGGGAPTFRTLTSGDVPASGITLGTAATTTGGTSIDFTGIPATAKMISVSLSGVSTSGTSRVMLQLGDSGGIEATGYLGCCSRAGGGGDLTAFNGTAGASLCDSLSAASVRHGVFILFLMDSTNNTWAITGVVGYSNTTSAMHFGYVKSTSATLDRVRVTTEGGTDTFDAGLINIAYF